MISQMVFGERLLIFNFLPSLTLHPSRYAFFGAPEFTISSSMASVWHRHWSYDILCRLDLQDRPVIDVSPPALTLALMPPDRLARLARYVGAVLVAGQLRQAIAGDDVRRLSGELGDDVLAFARESVFPFESSAYIAANVPLSVASLDQWGCAALMRAMADSSPELLRRAELRLPLHDARTDLSIDSESCLAIALDVLKLTDPTWHS